MSIKSFIDSKFDEITDFIENNQKALDKDEGFRERVVQRCRHWALIASLISGPNLTIGELIRILKSNNMEGVIKFGMDATNNILVVADSKTNYTPESNEVLVDPDKDTFLTVASFLKEFDATIEGVE